MAWRGLHLSGPARLSLDDRQIVVDQDDGKVRLAIEDLAYVVIDTPQATLTSALMSACMAAGVAIVFTDDRHTPNGLALPFHRHHRQAAVAGIQASCSLPLRKRLWQALVSVKIGNQAAALRSTGRDGAAALSAMSKRVGSGDPDNLEARAAREYWNRLFPAFHRDWPGDYRNAALNYGYAVLRAGIARALVAYGLLPAFGVHHSSATNAFNLADDLIEPFRPFVDVLVWQLAEEGQRRDGQLSLTDRRLLAGVPNADARVGNEAVNLLVATEKAAESLVRAMETGCPAALMLPRMRAAAV